MSNTENLIMLVSETTADEYYAVKTNLTDGEFEKLIDEYKEKNHSYKLSIDEVKAAVIEKSHTIEIMKLPHVYS